MLRPTNNFSPSAPPLIVTKLSRSHTFIHSRGKAPRFARKRSTCGRYSATNAARSSGRGPCGPDDDITGTVGANAVAVADVVVGGGDGGAPNTSACRRALARLLAPVRPSPTPGIPGSGGTQELPQRHPRPTPQRHWAPRHASPHRSPPPLPLPLPLLPRRAFGMAATRVPTGAMRRVRRAHSDCGGRSRSRTTTSAPAAAPPPLPLALLLVPLAAALGVILAVVVVVVAGAGAVSPPTGSASACHWKSWHGRPRKFSTWRRARSVR